MITLCFTLSMPVAASWNGKWSGEGRFYAILRRVKDELANKILDERPYLHHWSDGWCACVDVKVVSGPDIRKIRAMSKGFCGYDWMVNTIISHQKILDSAALAKLLQIPVLTGA